MATFTHPILGTFDPSRPGNPHGTIAFGGRTVLVDLTIGGEGLTAADLKGLPGTVGDLAVLDRAAREAMVDDARSGDDDGAAWLYVTHHHEQLEAKDFQRLFGPSHPDVARAADLLSRMVLVRVGLYPESNDRRILLDYSIDPDVTDYLLCVSFDEEQEVVAVDLES